MHPDRRLMGPLLALVVTLALNLVPAEAPSITISNYVVEGVGFSAQPAVFRLDRAEGDRWNMSSARGEPWFEVVVIGSVIRLIGNGADESLDLAAALGLPEAWWDQPTVTPAGADPLALERVGGGIDVRWSGPLAAQVRW
jgi:hypothetical protein